MEQSSSNGLNKLSEHRLGETLMKSNLTFRCGNLRKAVSQRVQKLI
jgi:hypothetical protein